MGTREYGIPGQARNTSTPLGFEVSHVYDILINVFKEHMVILFGFEPKFLQQAVWLQMRFPTIHHTSGISVLLQILSVMARGRNGIIHTHYGSRGLLPQAFPFKL